MMFLLLKLSSVLRIETRSNDAVRVSIDGHEFVAIHPEWDASLYLGFYDWLRSADGVLLGVTLTVHDDRLPFKQLLPARSYVSWLASDVVRIRFSAGEIDERNSTDQEFSVSRCYVSDAGEVALLFDAAEVDRSEIDRLLVHRVDA